MKLKLVYLIYICCFSLNSYAARIDGKTRQLSAGLLQILFSVGAIFGLFAAYKIMKGDSDGNQRLGNVFYGLVVGSFMVTLIAMIKSWVA